jgi:hypothetical protein
MKGSCIAPLAIVATALLASCGGDEEAGMREGGGSGMLADSAVLAAMRDTGTVNRIIYDPAPDLSLSSAQQRRPEIFRPPAPAPAPARSQGSGVRGQGR